MRYAFFYGYRRLHPWWKFWVTGKWAVYKYRDPKYVLLGFTKSRAVEYVETINQLGGFHAAS